MHHDWRILSEQAPLRTLFKGQFTNLLIGALSCPDDDDRVLPFCVI